VLAVVGAVAWTLRTDSPWATAGALAAALVLTAALMLQLQDALSTERARRRIRKPSGRSPSSRRQRCSCRLR